ncbi:MAG: hypothetical protein LWW77_02260 [Propionibacteriales bacterium]|nr:hypothetical protein [Propionibacteriales bacterium]
MVFTLTERPPMRAVVPAVLIAAGLALTACSGTAAPGPSAPAASPSNSAVPPATSPSPSSSPAFTFPKRTADELARSEFRDGTVSAQIWHKVTTAGSYVVRTACAHQGAEFGYRVEVNGHKLTSATFTCGTEGAELINTVGTLKVGDRVDVGLTKVVAPYDAWAIVVPDPVG